MRLKDHTVEDICGYVAGKLRAERVRQGLTQSQMAEASEIPLRTYKRFEATGIGSTENLIKSLRTLNRLRALELLFPPSPVKHLSIIDRFQQIANAAMNKKT